MLFEAIKGQTTFLRLAGLGAAESTQRFPSFSFHRNRQRDGRKIGSEKDVMKRMMQEDFLTWEIEWESDLLPKLNSLSHGSSYICKRL